MNRNEIKKLIIEQLEFKKLQEAVAIDPKRIGKVDKYTEALPLLDKALEIVFSKRYRHVVKDIELVSLKPSTYRIILNNGYFIYLTYNHGNFVASIEGRRYSLDINQDQQRASKAVTELLKFSQMTLDKGTGDQSELNSMEAGSSGNVPMTGMGGSSMDTDLGPQDGAPDGGVDTGVNGTDYDPSFDAEIDDIINQK